MSNIEYSFMAEELSPLAGRRFDRIYKVEKGYRLKIADAHIIIEPGVRLHLTKYIEESGPADRFVQKVRAELDNSKLVSVRQVNDDRIMEFEFDRGTLVFEMFAKGNCILVKDGVTVVAMREESWAGREIRRGARYDYPPPSSEASLERALSDRFVIVCLMKLPLGKEYAKEVLTRCGIDEKTPGTGLSKEQVSCIEKEIGSIQSKLKPFLYIESGKPVDYGLISFSKYSSLEQKAAGTLSQALDEFYFHGAPEEEPQEALKLRKRLAEQEERLKQLESDEVQLREKGDFIYEKYGLVESVIGESRSMALDGIEPALKKFNAKVNKKEKSVELDL